MDALENDSPVRSTRLPITSSAMRFRTAFEHETLHHFRACQVFERPNRDRDPQCCRLSSTPDNARLDPFSRGSMKNHLVDEAAQQRLFLRLRQQSLPPHSPKMLTNRLECRLKLLT